MIVTGKRLSRRTLLKGMGAAIGLPFLDAMIPALGQTKAAENAAAPVRLAWLYLPNGIDMRHWTPAQEGPLGTLPGILASLEPMKSEINVISNLTANWGRPLQVGAGDHGRALAAYMTGVEVYKTTKDLRVTTSADQIAAREIGHLTRLPSLELGLEETRQSGDCDNGYSCAYTYNVSWKTESQPLPPLSDPRLVFERLFGADADEPAAARERRLAMRRSILDETLESTRKLESTLGGADRRKVEEYLTSVREIEQKVERAAKEGMTIDTGIDKPFGVPPEFPEYFRLMTDLLLVAFKADLTRISTVMIGREGSVRPYPEIGVADGHHPLTHHMGNMEMLDKVRRINTLHAKLFAEFVEKLKNTREGSGTLLDRSLIVYGSGLSDGNAHAHDQLPTVLAGRGGGAVRPGRHLVYQRETPVANLFATMLECVGVRPDHIGDSTGRLEGLS